MKAYYLMFIILLMMQPVYAQEKMVCMCDFEAQFPGGHQAMNDYIVERFRLPSEITYYRENTSRTYISFVITETGKITNITIDRGFSMEVDQQLKSIIAGMPDWIPHIFGCGEVYATRVRIPITIELR